MIEAFAAHATDESFAERVRPRRPDWCPDHPSPARFRDSIEAPSELVVAVSHQKARTAAPRGRVAKLLRSPLRTWLPRDVEMYDPARTYVDEEEREDRTKEDILEHQAALWTFVDHPGVEPTNLQKRPAAVFSMGRVEVDELVHALFFEQRATRAAVPWLSTATLTLW